LLLNGIKHLLKNKQQRIERVKQHQQNVSKTQQLRNQNGVE
jgi:hypothetical protein